VLPGLEAVDVAVLHAEGGNENGVVDVEVGGSVLAAWSTSWVVTRLPSRLLLLPDRSWIDRVCLPR
jgi:hypothetical protein